MASFFSGSFLDAAISLVNPNLAATRQSAKKITELLCVIVRRYSQEDKTFTSHVSSFMDGKISQCDSKEVAKKECLALLKKKFFQEGDFDIDSLLMDLRQLERTPDFNFTTLLTVIKETINSVVNSLTEIKGGEYQVDTNIIMGLFALLEYANKIKYVDGKINLDGLTQTVALKCNAGEIPEFKFSSLNDLDKKIRIELEKSLYAPDMKNVAL